MISILLLVHAAATLAMTGVIWFVQVVHYPLFDRVGRAEFPEYEAGHTRRTSLVVGPAMLVEALSTLTLFSVRLDLIPWWSIWGGAVLLVLIWLTTFLVAVPCHSVLSKGFDGQTAERLVRVNWIRTVCWTLRSILALAMASYWMQDAHGS